MMEEWNGGKRCYKLRVTGCGYLDPQHQTLKNNFMGVWCKLEARKDAP